VKIIESLLLTAGFFNEIFINCIKLSQNSWPSALADGSEQHQKKALAKIGAILGSYLKPFLYSFQLSVGFNRRQ